MKKHLTFFFFSYTLIVQGGVWWIPWAAQDRELEILESLLYHWILALGKSLKLSVSVFHLLKMESYTSLPLRSVNWLMLAKG